LKYERRWTEKGGVSQEGKKVEYDRTDRQSSGRGKECERKKKIGRSQGQANIYGKRTKLGLARMCAAQTDTEIKHGI